YLRPPFVPPLRELDFVHFFARPPPPFFRPPLSELFTVAHARLSASLLLTPRFLQPLSIFDAFRFCFDVYFFLLPRAIAYLLKTCRYKNGFRASVGFNFALARSHT